MIIHPLISVIIPVYNTKLFFLKQCFDSINEQTYSNLEIIIIDASDNGETTDFVVNYCFKYERVLRIFSGRGVSFQRNVGIDNSTGDYVAFIDSDDFINKEYFSELLSSIQLGNYDISFPLINKKIFKNNTISHNWDFNHKDAHSELSEFNFFVFSLNNAFVHPIKLYDKRLLEETRFHCELKFGEDLVFNYELTKNYPQVVFCEKAVYSYCSEEKTNLVKKHLDFSLFKFLDWIIGVYRTRKKRKIECSSMLPFFCDPFLNFYYLACKRLYVRWLLLSIKYRLFYFTHYPTLKNFAYMFFPLSFSLVKKLSGRYN